jgi:HAD superfamily hydrolase (TIGR01490 family)
MAAAPAPMPRRSGGAARLVLFDLDHTLLDGDSDALWIDTLAAALADAGKVAALRAADADIQARYRDGSCGVLEFCEFYLGSIALLDAAAAEALRARFFAERVRPRLFPQALDLVARHRAAGDRLLLTSATSRFLCEPTAAHLGGIELLATEGARDAHGRHTGRVAGTPNMRAGKVERLQGWLRAQGLDAARDFAGTVAYSDSINDLPLLEWAQTAVAVNPDPRLAAVAAARGWQVLRFRAD